jgi:signal transduction histidine kinase
VTQPLLDQRPPSRERRTRREPPGIVDVVGAALLITFLVLATSHIARGEDEHSLDAFGYALLVVAGGSVVLVRRWPRTALAVVTVVLGLYIVGRYQGGPVYVTGWVALFFLSWRTDRRTGLVGAAALCAVLSVTSLVVRGSAPLLHLVFIGWAAAAVFLGDALRNRRSYLRELEEHARYLEQTREEESRRRVAEERLRIARDLHDSVAHAIATINVQAGAAAHVIDRRPTGARASLDAIQHTSAEVLDELTAMLLVLRDEGDVAERSPTPGATQIPDLVRAAHDAHLPVTLHVEGSLAQVSVPVGTAMYRIVQESLTNVMRHAPGATTRVVTRVVPDRGVVLDVIDDGPRVPGPTPQLAGGSGMGIRGMRERVAATGGALEVGPRADGGFHVRASWPNT